MRIKWHVEKHPRNSTKIIIIDECPKCGKSGRLTKNGRGFIVIHGRYSRSYCNFGTCSEYYEELVEIYNRVRNNGF